MPRPTLKIETDEKFKNLTEGDWNAKVKLRGCDKRKDKVLDDACECYAKKVPTLRRMLLEGIQVPVENPDGTLKSVAEVLALRADEEANINAKIERLLDKAAACEKELKDRKDGKVARKDLV